MPEQVGDFLLKRLREWGIHRIYGYPGDGINAILGAFNRADSDPELIQVRHEEMAAFMACAHAKFTGEVGVCLATSGPGAIHLLNGLVRRQARPSAGARDRRPAGAVSRSGGSYQQEVDLTTLFKDVAHEYVEMASSPVQIRHLVDRAMRIAKDQRTVTCLIIPNDVAEMDGGRDAAARARHDPLGRSATRRRRSCRRRSDLRRAADALNAGEKVAMLVGAGALGRGGRGRRGRGAARRRRREGAAGQGGAAGRSPVRDRIDRAARDEAELGPDDGLRHAADGRLELSVLGVPAGGGPGARRADRHRRAHDRHPLPDGGAARRRQSKATLRALIPLLERKQDRSWREEIEHGTAKWWRLMEERALASADPINPQRLFSELSKRLPDRADPQLRLGLVRQLVRARRADPQGDDGVAVGQPRDDGAGRAVRDRCEVRASGSRRDRAGRRRRDADERAGRADHDRASTGGAGPIRASSCSCCTTTI